MTLFEIYRTFHRQVDIARSTHDLSKIYKNIGVLYFEELLFFNYSFYSTHIIIKINTSLDPYDSYTSYAKRCLRSREILHFVDF